MLHLCAQQRSCAHLNGELDHLQQQYVPMRTPRGPLGSCRATERKRKDKRGRRTGARLVLSWNLEEPVGKGALGGLALGFSSLARVRGALCAARRIRSLRPARSHPGAHRGTARSWLETSTRRGTPCGRIIADCFLPPSVEDSLSYLIFVYLFNLIILRTYTSNQVCDRRPASHTPN